MDPYAECQSLDVECVAGDLYTWDPSTSSCMCVLIYVIDKRVPIMCDIACVPPEAHDPNAISPGCNCAERVCPPGHPACPVDLAFGWDEQTNECGCVASPEAECVATNISCVAGYTYGWNYADGTCQCLAN